jgi:hypothetical protein
MRTFLCLTLNSAANRGFLEGRHRFSGLDTPLLYAGNTQEILWGVFFENEMTTTRSGHAIDADNFWCYLCSFGGGWMWDHVELPLGLDAVVDAISAGSAVFVTDGLYNRGVHRDLDGAGWLVYCTMRRRIILRGLFYEQNSKAGSYRAELLGLLAIHTFLLAVETFYDLPAVHRGLVVCDNLGALNKAKEKCKKIPAGAKHADIRRCLPNAHSKLSRTLAYKHVYGHQDRKKKWHQLTVLEKLNCKCDTLAGETSPSIPTRLSNSR